MDSIYTANNKTSNTIKGNNQLPTFQTQRKENNRKKKKIF